MRSRPRLTRAAVWAAAKSARATSRAACTATRSTGGSGWRPLPAVASDRTGRASLADSPGYTHPGGGSGWRLTGFALDCIEPRCGAASGGSDAGSVRPLANRPQPAGAGPCTRECAELQGRAASAGGSMIFPDGLFPVGASRRDRLHRASRYHRDDGCPAATPAARRRLRHRAALLIHRPGVGTRRRRETPHPHRLRNRPR